MKLVFNQKDVLDMVEDYLARSTSFQPETLSIALVGDELWVGIDEVVGEPTEAPEQLELPLEEKPKQRRKRMPRKVEVIEEQDEEPIEVTPVEEVAIEEIIEEVNQEFIEEKIAELDEALVVEESLFTVQEEPTVEPLFDTSKPLFG